MKRTKPMADDEMEFERAKSSFDSWRRHEKKPRSSAELLSRLIAQQGLAQTQWHDQLQSEWQQLLDSEMDGKTVATVVKRGVLEVVVESSAAMQQLAFQKKQLLSQLQQKLPNAKINSIRFKVGPVR